MINKLGNLTCLKELSQLNASEISVDFSRLPGEQIDDFSDDHSDGDDFELEDYSNGRHEANSLGYDFYMKSLQDDSASHELGEK